MAPTKWTRKDSWFRYFFSIFKQIRLTWRPVLVTGGMMLFWYWVMWPSQIKIAPGDSERLLLFSAVALMLALFFISGFLYAKIDDRRDKVVKAILKKNKKKFLMLRDERTPNFSLVFQGTLSILLVAHALLLPWETVWGGLSAVGTITFIGAKLWVLITHLDDPVGSSKWIQERVPDDWMAIDVDEFFKCDGTEECAVQVTSQPKPVSWWRRQIRALVQ